MKYFLHDTSAFSDEKITLLNIEFGFEGVGLFYTILERIAQQEKPVAEKVLKAQLGIRKRLQKQLDFMYEIDLLSVKNGEVFNENLLKFSEKYQIKKEKTRKRVSDWRDNQKDTKNVTCYEHVSNAPKVKESKVKESKETLKSNIEKLYNLYPSRCPIKNSPTGKGSKNKTQIETILKTKSFEELDKIIKWYVKECTNSKTYIKNFSTFLNNLPDIVETNTQPAQQNKYIDKTKLPPKLARLNWRHNREPEGVWYKYPDTGQFQGFFRDIGILGWWDTLTNEEKETIEITRYF